jgi:hypothetical protein
VTLDNSPSYFQIIAILDEAFVRNVIITLCINYVLAFIDSNSVINNNLRKTPRLYFALQNSHGHAKEFLRNLYTVWARAHKS